MRGAVRDPLGVIPGAEVTLIHAGTTSQRSAMPNEAGEYTFSTLRPGTYTVRVALPGFKAEQRTHVRIAARQSALVDFIFEVAAAFHEIPEESSRLRGPRLQGTQGAGSRGRPSQLLDSPPGRLRQPDPIRHGRHRHGAEVVSIHQTAERVRVAYKNVKTGAKTEIVGGDVVRPSLPERGAYILQSNGALPGDRELGASTVAQVSSLIPTPTPAP